MEIFLSWKLEHSNSVNSQCQRFTTHFFTSSILHSTSMTTTNLKKPNNNKKNVIQTWKKTNVMRTHYGVASASMSLSSQCSHSLRLPKADKAKKSVFHPILWTTWAASTLFTWIMDIMVLVYMVNCVSFDMRSPLFGSLCPVRLVPFLIFFTFHFPLSIIGGLFILNESFMLSFGRMWKRIRRMKFSYTHTHTKHEFNATKKTYISVRRKPA